MQTTISHLPPQCQRAQISTSWKPVRYAKNDPRTTLAVVLAINVTVFGGASAPVLVVATAIVGVLFASVGTLTGVIRFLVLESGFLLLLTTVVFSVLTQL